LSGFRGIFGVSAIFEPVWSRKRSSAFSRFSPQPGICHDLDAPLNVSETDSPPDSSLPPRQRRRLGVARVVAIIVLGLLALAYGRLLVGPISLNFLSDRVQSMVAGVVDDSFAVDWEEFGLSLSGPVNFAFRLSDVTLTERANQSVITMEALDISVSPFGMMRGRPEASVVMIDPHFQVVQDLLGTRLSRFDIVDPGDGTPAVV
jgi:hypothetical protein